MMKNLKARLTQIVLNPAQFSVTVRNAAALALATMATGANAAAITLPTELTDALTSVALIGAAVFAIAVGVKLYKWIKGAL